MGAAAVSTCRRTRVRGIKGIQGDGADGAARVLGCRTDVGPVAKGKANGALLHAGAVWPAPIYCPVIEHGGRNYVAMKSD